MRKQIKAIFVLSLSLSLLFSFSAFAATAKKNHVEDYNQQAASDAVSGPSTGSAAGSGNSGSGQNATAVEPAPERTTETGTSLGIFSTTGYSNDNNQATASGVWPHEKHTASADWSILPKGTKFRFADSDIVYTVEDSGVSGRTIDIFYETHDAASAHGVQNKEIFLLP